MGTNFAPEIIYQPTWTDGTHCESSSLQLGSSIILDPAVLLHMSAAASIAFLTQIGILSGGWRSYNSYSCASHLQILCWPAPED